MFNDPSHVQTLDESLEMTAQIDRVCEPGRCFYYSNSAYILLGRIIEAVTGQPHEQVIANRIFDRLGMQDTTYSPETINKERMMRGYLELYGDGVLVDATDIYMLGCGPADGVASTVYDLHVFIESVFRDRVLLNEDSLAAMQEWVVATDWNREKPLYGLGLTQRVTADGTGIGHDGHHLGYQTGLYYFPDSDLTFVLAVNASSIEGTEESLDHAVELIKQDLLSTALEGL